MNFWFLNLSLELWLNGRFKSRDDNRDYMCLMPLSTIFHLYHEKPDWAQITSSCIKNYSPWSGIKFYKLFVDDRGSWPTATCGTSWTWETNLSGKHGHTARFSLVRIGHFYVLSFRFMILMTNHTNSCGRHVFITEDPTCNYWDQEKQIKSSVKKNKKFENTKGFTRRRKTKKDLNFDFFYTSFSGFSFSIFIQI